MYDDIIKSLEVLKSGGTILYPTDTIWGIGCDATNEEAIDKIYGIKKREETKSMIILLDTDAKLMQYVDDVPDVAYDLIELSDKPLTIIFSKAKNLPSNLINNDGSIAIRIVKDEFCQKLISRFRKPIVSTSANISGETSPLIFDKISDLIKQSVDYAVNWRQDDFTKSRPSGIIKLDNSGIVKVIRS